MKVEHLVYVHVKTFVMLTPTGEADIQYLGILGHGQALKELRKSRNGFVLHSLIFPMEDESRRHDDKSPHL